MADKVIIKSDAPILQMTAERDGIISLRSHSIPDGRTALLASEYLEISWVEGRVCATIRKKVTSVDGGLDQAPSKTQDDAP